MKNYITRTLKVTLLEDNKPVKFWAVSRCDDPFWLLQVFKAVLKDLFEKEKVTSIK